MIFSTDQKLISCWQMMLEHTEDVSLADQIALLPHGQSDATHCIRIGTQNHSISTTRFSLFTLSLLNSRGLSPDGKSPLLHEK